MSEPVGVIHDIGYRRYDGPRLDRRSIVWALLVESLRSAFGLGRAARSKVAPLLLLAILTLPALVWAVVATFIGTLPVEIDQFAFTLQPIVMIFVATQAPVLVARDLRFRVMPLYLSRPMSRADYVLAKLAALTVAIFAFLAVPLTVLLAGSLLAELPAKENIVAWATAFVGLGLLALLLASIALLVASLAPRRGLGVAAIVTVLLVLSAVHVAVYEISRAGDGDQLASFAALISPFALVAGLSHRLLGTWQPPIPFPDGAAGIVVPLLVAAAVVVGSVGLLLARYRKVPVS